MMSHPGVVVWYWVVQRFELLYRCGSCGGLHGMHACTAMHHTRQHAPLTFDTYITSCSIRRCRAVGCLHGSGPLWLVCTY
jgi:hypothetical protein